MSIICKICLLIAIGSVFGVENDFRGFDDTIMFGINWPGSPFGTPSDDDLLYQSSEILTVTTSHKEKYDCHLPELRDKESASIEEYYGPSPINLLQPLFLQKICSYRLESYWGYEVCHGRFVRQYHEEREGKQVKTQEYFLGHWSPEKQEKANAKEEQDKKNSLKTTQVEGISIPYVEIVMDEGTICDLNGKPRSTKVLYVCYIHGKHEVYSFKEISTCEYEIIILSPLLCEHPQFKPKDKNQNMINCIPQGDAPKKPRNLLKNEVENLKFLQQSSKLTSDDDHSRDVLAVLKVEKIEQDGETHLKFELHPLNEQVGVEESSAPTTPAPQLPPPVTDDSPVRAFLNGENCLNGGSGWWKYEFCYGSHVMQYHVDRAGEKTTLLLGKFDQQAHIDWIKENQSRAPQPKDKRSSISHFYSNGDICDKTQKPRQTEVKLKCVKNMSNAAQVTLYLLEPRTCHYILGVESPLICEILPFVDEYGLVKSDDVQKDSDYVVVNTEDDGEIKEKEVNKFGLD